MSHSEPFLIEPRCFLCESNEIVFKGMFQWDVKRQAYDVYSSDTLERTGYCINSQCMKDNGIDLKVVRWVDIEKVSNAKSK